MTKSLILGVLFMANFIYSRTTDKDLQTFYLVNNGKEYYLFTQKFYRGVKNYFHNKVLLNDALDMTKTNRDTALIRTKAKLPMYIKYIEKEYGIFVLENSIKKKAKTRSYPFERCGYKYDSCDYCCA
jgi:hypothetical protein